jgi:SAM-dependent methyltransferase
VNEWLRAGRANTQLADALAAGGCWLLARNEVSIDELARPVGIVASPLEGDVAVFRLEPRLAAHHQLFLGRRPYQRVLDRFFLPAEGDPCVATALFELSARFYRRLVDTERNTRTIRYLLETAIRLAPGRSPIRILDFGCGPGLSLHAAGSLAKRRIDLIGVDASPAMVRYAQRTGLRALALGEWRSIPPQSFEAIIGSYVLHCGLEPGELEILTRQLVPGGVFVANGYHADKYLERLRTEAARVGLTMEQSSTEREPLLVLTRPLE